MSLSPIPKVLSSMRAHSVGSLLMGGQACVLYGAAEFSRDAWRKPSMPKRRLSASVTVYTGLRLRPSWSAFAVDAISRRDRSPSTDVGLSSPPGWQRLLWGYSADFSPLEAFVACVGYSTGGPGSSLPIRHLVFRFKHSTFDSYPTYHSSCSARTPMRIDARIAFASLV